LINFRSVGRVSIDRDARRCRTPRRNEQVERQLEQARSLYEWCGGVAAYVRTDRMAAQPSLDLDLTLLAKESPFVPVLPLFEKSAGAGALSIRSLFCFHPCSLEGFGSQGACAALRCVAGGHQRRAALGAPALA